MKRSFLVVVLILAAAPVVGVNSIAITPVSETEVKELMLARDLEEVGLTANAASLIRDGKTEKALHLLDQQLALSLSSAGQRLDAGVRLPRMGSASLREAPRRARDYAVQNKRDVLAAQASAVFARVNQ